MDGVSRGGSGAPVLLSMLMAGLGLAALGATLAAGGASMGLLGGLLTGSGVVELLRAFGLRRERSFLQHLLSGILALVVGLAIVGNPQVALSDLALLLAGFFLTAGLFRGIDALVERPRGWGWDVAYGLVAVLLGASLGVQWPASSPWLLGTLVGVELVVRGVTLMAGSFRFHRVPLRRPA